MFVKLSDLLNLKRLYDKSTIDQSNLFGEFFQLGHMITLRSTVC